MKLRSKMSIIEFKFKLKTKFLVMLGLAIVIGVYYAWKDRKKETMDTYYFGGRNMSPVII